MVDEEQPGVTLHFEHADLLPPSKAKNMLARARLTLNAEIYDIDAWEQVCKRFENGGAGMRIYLSGTFAEEMVDVMKERHSKEREELTAKVAQLERDLGMAKASVAMLQRQLGISAPSDVE